MAKASTRTHIRIALSVLKRDTNIPIPRNQDAAAEMLRKLWDECREAGLLKVDCNA